MFPTSLFIEPWLILPVPPGLKQAAEVAEDIGAVVAAAPATPGSPAIPSPQPPQHAPDSPMVVLNHQPDAHPHFLLASGQKTAGLVAPGQLGPGQIMSGTINQAGVMATNPPLLKIRQQRKQSLK